MSGLSLEAERFLSDLRRALSTVEEAEREAILLELRGHLEHRQDQGALQEALAGLGDPVCVAASFIEAHQAAAANGSPTVTAVHLPTVFSSSSWALNYTQRVPRLGLQELAANLRASWRASRDEIWSICAVLFAGLLVTDFLAALLSSDSIASEAPRAAALCARTAVATAGLVALYRAFLTDDQPVWGFDGGLARFATASIGLLGVSVLAVGIVTGFAATLHAALGGTTLPMPARLLIALGVALPISCASLRLQPWLVDAALGSRRLSLRLCWLLTERRMKGLVPSWLVTVAPLFALHGATSSLIQGLSRDSLVRFGLGLCALDAIFTIAMMLAIAALNSISYRSVLREPIPDAFLYASPYARRSRARAASPVMRIV